MYPPTKGLMTTQRSGEAKGGEAERAAKRTAQVSAAHPEKSPALTTELLAPLAGLFSDCNPRSSASNDA